MNHSFTLKILFHFTIFVFVVKHGFSQKEYWQQQANYIIDVRLNDSSHSLDAFMKLQYINNSPDTLTFIWFHIWPNAFKNDRTAFSEQMLEHHNTKFYFSDKEQRGYINRLDFRTDNKSLTTEDHPLYIDVIKVHLGQPLLPGAEISINTPFHVQLPENFSRGGHIGQTYQITQWFPKPAVYDRKGWHVMPYLSLGEYYSEFGDFDVRITLPKNYVVASTGVLQNESEKQWLQSKAAGHWPLRKMEEELRSVFQQKNTKNKSTAANEFPISDTEEKTIQFRQNNVHDFAWFADKRFVVKQDTVMLATGKRIEAFAFFISTSEKKWANSMRYIKDALHFRSSLIGEYPYTALSVVEAPLGFSGGMEYPMITNISPSINDEAELEMIIGHEIGHNWFQAALATDERTFPWMDEGMNTYYDLRYEEAKNTANEKHVSRKLPANVEELIIDVLAARKLDQPINTPSEDFTELNYHLSSYYRAAAWMKKLETMLSRNVFDDAMKRYFQQWKFRHPYPEDFKQSIEESADKPLSQLFELLDETGIPTYHTQKRKLKPVLLFSAKDYSKYVYLNLIPLIGYNVYDNLQAGIAIHNFNAALNKLQFFTIPLYSTGAQQLNGSAGIYYTHYTNSGKLVFASNLSRYSSISGVDSNGSKIFGGFSKLTPSIKFKFNKQLRSSREKWIEWKLFLIAEKGFEYKLKTADSIYYPTPEEANKRYLNQLTMQFSDFRVLYPYKFQIQFQQGEGFYRLNATGHYYFNYPNGGGLEVRAFAAKFGYLGNVTATKQFETSLYHPKLTAVRGYEDYTYGNYFFGRNERDGIAAQQIMLRDGGLKIRTDLFQGLQGRSDNWIASMNFNSTLPNKFFPIKTPLRLFLDVGTYAETWTREAATPKLLFVGGLQLSLFKDLLNVYAPIVYSRDFKENLQTVPEENTFFKKISFSIDIQRIQLRRFISANFPFDDR